MKLRKGFTLVELLVVVAIIGILVLIAVPRFQSMTEGARRRTVEANHRIIVSAITMYIANNNGQLPPVSANMDVLDEFMSPTFLQLNGGGAAPHDVPSPAGAAYAVTAGTGGGNTLQVNSSLDGTVIATWDS